MKIYKRPLNSGTARVLIEIYRIDCTIDKEENGWFHLMNECTSRRVNAMGMEYSKLQHWGFIEPRGDEPDTGARSSGFWRITKVGREFVEGSLSVPKHIYLYDQAFIRFGDERTTIQEALGEKFSYADLMGHH